MAILTAIILGLKHDITDSRGTALCTTKGPLRRLKISWTYTS